MALHLLDSSGNVLVVFLRGILGQSNLLRAQIYCDYGKDMYPHPFFMRNTITRPYSRLNDDLDKGMRLFLFNDINSMRV